MGRYALELLRRLLASNSADEYVLHGWSFSLDRSVVASLARPGVTLRVSRLPGTVKRLTWNHIRRLPIRTFTGPIDIFHSCDPFLPGLGRARGIATVHDLCQRRFPEYFDRPVLRRDRHLSRSLESADAIIVPSKHTMSDLVEMFAIPGDRVHVVYPSIDTRFHPQTPDDSVADAALRQELHLEGKIALFVGTLEPRKNLVTLIKAFEEANHIAPDILTLVIAGKPGWLYRDIFRAIEDSPIRRKIRYLRYVSDEHLASLYRLAHLFVYPSFYEGFGYPVFEAMASGIPVVTSDSSSLKELAGGAAELTDPTNQQAITDALLRVTQNEDRRLELRIAGLERVRWLSTQDTVGRVNRIYRHLAEVD